MSREYTTTKAINVFKNNFSRRRHNTIGLVAKKDQVKVLYLEFPRRPRINFLAE